MVTFPRDMTVWFMKSVGLNISSSTVIWYRRRIPNFVLGLQKAGIRLFLWGIVATSSPLILAVSAGNASSVLTPRSCCTTAVAPERATTTAALGMICDSANSQVPALGYTVTYAIGNTLLTIWGMVAIMLLS